jgi:hypothetical protein
MPASDQKQTLTALEEEPCGIGQGLVAHERLDPDCRQKN